MRESRDDPISFGLLDLGGKPALLFLAPPYPSGGYLGNHLVLVWEVQEGRHAISLHAWEPLTEAVATLRRMALSAKTSGVAPRLSARSDRDGVLYVNGFGWTCPGEVRVDLPPPGAETNVQPINDGDFHLTYARPTVKPYAGIVIASQECGTGDDLRAQADIDVGDRRGPS